MADNKSKVNKEETVTVRLHRERNQDAAEIVWVNDKRYEIKRGVDVEVPKSVAEVLRSKERMMDILYDTIEANAK